MKSILIGDIHIDYFKDVDFYHDMFEEIINKVLDTMKQKTIKNIIIMGDVFDSRRNPNIRSVIFIVNLFNDILNKHQDKTIHIITGNHDVYYKNTNEITSLDYFQHDRINIIKEPTEFGNMLLIPWITKNNRDKILEVVKNTNMEYCLGHLEFAGFKQNSKDVHLSRGMSITEFKKFKKVISGHIHYSSRNANVLYTGNIQQIKKDDRDDPKKYWILDTEEHTVEPVYHGVNLMEDVFITEDFEHGTYTNKKVYIRVDEGITDKKLDKIVENIRLQKPLSINIYDNPNKIKKNIDIDYQIDAQKTTLDFVKEYIDKIDNINIDNSEIFDIMQTYYQLCNGR